MSDHIYKIVEVVGSSSTSIEDAIEGAIARTARTVSDIGWFEVKETRGHVANGKVANYQLPLRIGFTVRACPPQQKALARGPITERGIATREGAGSTRKT